MDTDSMFINQTELYETLTKFLTNIKKDGSERRTIDNYKRKADMLEVYWREYQENHRKMCEFAELDHVYFKKGCFDTVEEVYSNIKEIIDKTIKQLLGVSPRRPEAGEAQPSPDIRTKQQLSVSQRRLEAGATQPQPGPAFVNDVTPQRDDFLPSAGGSSKLDELMKKQNLNFKAFLRTVSKTQVDKFENQWQFENALRSLDSRWREIDKLHWEIEGENGSEDINYQEQFCEHEETYIELTETINTKMWSVKHRERSAPQMDIPVFHGTYDHWVSFKDLFSEAIDKNPSISNAQKIQFLKSKVAGEAERLIHHLQISSDNYKSITCALCNTEHALWRCPTFLEMTPLQKSKKIEQLNFCQNCLCNHFKKPCISVKRCRKCLGKHNTLLHDALVDQSTTTSAKPNAKQTNSEATKENTFRSSHVSWDDRSEILLATAVVKVTGSDGTQHTMRALVDQGSQLSLINENAAQILGLKRAHFKGQIYGAGEKENSSKGMIEIALQSTHSKFSFATNVIIINNLIKRLPNNTFTKPSSWDHIQGINLADQKFNVSRPVDLLLGADVYSKIMLGGILRGDKDEQPIAQQTQLGWLLVGSMKPYYHCNVVLNNTEELLKFWENEDINQKIEMSNDDHE
ncbi:Uncharacterized protein OBRU01_06070, partial [Operophtera brumata]